MRKITLSDIGHPGDVLNLVPDLVGALIDDQVRVKIEASPIHIADLKFITGALPFPWDFPATPGCEAIGTIVEKGAEVFRFDVGDRVFIPPVVARKTGTWRQTVDAAASELIAAPSGDAQQLCLAPINGMTAYALLHAVTQLQPGDALIHNAANSSCGQYLTGLAKRAGIVSIAVVRRSETMADLKSLGADFVFVDGDDLADRVSAAVGDLNIKLGIDAVAGDATQRIADCLSVGGHLAIYGLLSGQPCSIRPETAMMKQLTMKGFLSDLALQQLGPDAETQMWREIPPLFSSGSLKAKIAAAYPLEEIAKACEHASRSGQNRDGKIILLPNE